MVTWDAFLRSRVTNPETRKRYDAVVRSFRGWLGSRPLNDLTVAEYREKLLSDFKPNSLSNMVAAINLHLESKGLESRMKRPPKEIAANPKIISDKEYEELLSRIPYLDERLVIRLLHDTGLRPSDVVSIRLEDIDRSEGVTSIRKRTRKTGAVTDSILTKETVAELEAYIKETGRLREDYLFRGALPIWTHREMEAQARKIVRDGGVDLGELGFFPSPDLEDAWGKVVQTTDTCGVRSEHRHRTWPNAVLRKYGAEGITPRTFRRTLATNWTEDTTSLMAQGGWTDSKTIFLHYRRDVRARHIAAAEKTLGRVRDPDPEDDPPGYV